MNADQIIHQHMKYLRTLYIVPLSLILLLSCQKQQPAPEPEKDSSAFVNLTDIIPDAILEIRYYSTYNFVGEMMVLDVVMG